MKKPKRLSLLALVLASLFSASSQAGSFSVTPVRFFFGPKDRAMAVTLENGGDSEIALQADINQWTQDAAGVDKLELTEDMLVAPPVIKIPPRGKQVVRLALLVPRDPSRQMTYRLVVREVPEAIKIADGKMQLPVALAMNMPVFITPPGAQREVACKLGSNPARKLEAVCSNSGTAYAQLRNVELKRGADTLASFDGSLYLLPGASKPLPIKASDGPAPASGPAELVVTFDDLKPQSYPVTVP